MLYGSFLDCLEKEILHRSVSGEKIHRIQILKNNGVRLDGFSFQTEFRKEQPTVYVNHYYKEEIRLQEVEKIAEQILGVMRQSALRPGCNLEELLDYEKMKSRIFYRLISRKKNEELLKEVPFLPWLDLALVFYIRVPEDFLENATILIRNEHMERWKLDLHELYQRAIQNRRKTQVLFCPMEQFLENCGLSDVQSGMYVLSNEYREYGAAAIADPDIQKMCAQKLGENYYVLPSSIHEVILLPESMATTREELDALVQEANACCVSQEEFLSDHAYYYSAEKERLYF
jgi:hypothetical protein